MQRLTLEQEQDRINQLRHNPEPEDPENSQASPLVTPKNEESCWVDDPLTSEDEYDSQQSIQRITPIRVTYNVIIWDDSSSEASSTEAIYSQTASGISFGATSSQVTSTEISPSQASSPETVRSELKPLPTDHLEEAPSVEVFFNESRVN